MAKDQQKVILVVAAIALSVLLFSPYLGIFSYFSSDSDSDTASSESELIRRRDTSTQRRPVREAPASDDTLRAPAPSRKLSEIEELLDR